MQQGKEDIRQIGMGREREREKREMEDMMLVGREGREKGECNVGGSERGERIPKQLNMKSHLFAQYQFPKAEASQVSLYYQYYTCSC